VFQINIERSIGGGQGYQKALRLTISYLDDIMRTQINPDNIVVPYATYQ
jgi:hypothetical protein